VGGVGGGGVGGLCLGGGGEFPKTQTEEQTRARHRDVAPPKGTGSSMASIKYRHYYQENDSLVLTIPIEKEESRTIANINLLRKGRRGRKE